MGNYLRIIDFTNTHTYTHMRANHAKVIGTDQNITIHRTVAYKNAQSCGCATAIDAKAIER